MSGDDSQLEKTRRKEKTLYKASEQEKWRATLLTLQEEEKASLEN